jgi:hypothetical protein
MGSEISAGRLFRPIETPRPAEPPPRPDSGGEGFQSYLESARSTVAPLATQSVRRGESARQPKSSDRKDRDVGAQETAQPQTPADQPTESGNTNSADDTTGAAAPIEASPTPVQEAQTSDTSTPKAANTIAPVLQQKVVESLPPTAANSDKAIPSAALISTDSQGKVAQADTAPKAKSPAIENHASLPQPILSDELSVSPEVPVTLPVAEEPVSDDVQVDQPPNKASSKIEKAEDGSIKEESLKPAQRWSPDVGVTQRPVEKVTPKSHAQSIKEAGSNSGAADRVEGKLGRPTLLNGAEPRSKDAGSVDPNEHISEDRAGPRIRPISVRTGAGDSAAANVGRFLIETTGDGEPTTANIPPPVDGKISTALSPGVTPYRAITGSPKTADATVTTLSRLLVSGPDGADAIDSAAKVLSGAQREGDHHVTLQLDPPELGQLRLDIRMHQQEMTLRVAADNASVARLINSRMSDLRDALALHGIRIDRSDVVVRSHSTDSANAQTSQHDNSRGTMNGGDRAEKPDVAWSDDHRREAARDEQSGADPQPAGSASPANEETPVAPLSWESGMEGSEMEQTWVDLVA